MPKKPAPPAPYPDEFRARLIELARAGQTPEELARKFEPSAQTIRNWLRSGGAAFWKEECWALAFSRLTTTFSIADGAKVAALRRCFSANWWTSASLVVPGPCGTGPDSGERASQTLPQIRPCQPLSHLSHRLGKLLAC